MGTMDVLQNLSSRGQSLSGSSQMRVNGLPSLI
uniref:Uncharacterized protein n=1 Tax=Myoviridae sp. ctBtT5 TaxID=2825048 RepID=A0A8S5PYJ4_9CAUD|nr:MAG TPA: hypothetical protein [Myoviridae sp. ctBtT5]